MDWPVALMRFDDVAALPRDAQPRGSDKRIPATRLRLSPLSTSLGSGHRLHHDSDARTGLNSQGGCAGSL